MRLVAGVHATDKGRVIFDGDVVDTRDQAQLYRLRRPRPTRRPAIPTSPSRSTPSTSRTTGERCSKASR
jgi:hypothetical protein